MVTMRVGRVACVMLLATSAAWAQSQPCSTHGTSADCEGQLCENDMQYCVWNVAAGSCGCPSSCTEYSGLNPEQCVNSACPFLLPQQHVPCTYDYDTQNCWCPEAAETGAPATPAPPTAAPPTSAPAPSTTPVPTTDAPEHPLCNETTLVFNPSFEIITTTTNIAEALENGQVPGWTASHWTPTVMGGAPGQGQRSAWMWSYAGGGEGIVTNVPFADGQMYQVSMWVTTGNSLNGQFFVTAADGLVPQTAGYPLPSFTDSEVMYSNGMVFPDWEEISFNYTATDAYTQLWIYPLWAGRLPQAQVRVDNIRVCAVGTDAPATPVPPTSAPPTSAPPTPVPATPAPPTPAPPTSAPPTSAPPTPVPATPAPATPAPPTSAPPTSAPPTPAPATPAPPTPAPPTSAPPTSAPPTPAPAAATPWPVISDDCSSFHGLPRTCMSSLCSVSGRKASCKYDFSSNLCLCA